MPTTTRPADLVDVEAAADDALDAVYTAISTLAQPQALEVIERVQVQLDTQAHCLRCEIERDA